YVFSNSFAAVVTNFFVFDYRTLPISVRAHRAHRVSAREVDVQVQTDSLTLPSRLLHPRMAQVADKRVPHVLPSRAVVRIFHAAMAARMLGRLLVVTSPPPSTPGTA